jgi:hypothetical protein
MSSPRQSSPNKKSPTTMGSGSSATRSVGPDISGETKTSLGSSITAAGGATATSNTSAATGARIHQRYTDRTEDAIAVTRDDLREIGTISWLQEGVGGIGLFFLSGSFWLLLTLFAEHGNDPDFYSWYLACPVIMVCGAALVAVGIALFRSKRKRLHKYFPDGGDGSSKLP